MSAKSILIILGILSGYALAAYVKYSTSDIVRISRENVEKLQNTVDSLENSGTIVIADIIKSREKVNAILNSPASSGKKEISLEDALKIIKGIK